VVTDSALRELVAKLLAWEDAHVGFDAAVADLAPDHRGVRPAGVPWSAWQLVEHLRIAQEDILDFCRNPDYREMKWPDDYWPTSPEPPSTDAWTASLERFVADRRALQQLAADPSINLGARIAHGSGQTYIRELLLVADHTSYHVGQLILLRRILGVWPA
jgi:uncharacterized damage-inducible protein DinB